MGKGCQQFLWSSLQVYKIPSSLSLSHHIVTKEKPRLETVRLSQQEKMFLEQGHFENRSCSNKKPPRNGGTNTCDIGAGWQSFAVLFQQNRQGQVHRGFTVENYLDKQKETKQVKQQPRPDFLIHEYKNPQQSQSSSHSWFCQVQHPLPGKAVVILAQLQGYSESLLWQLLNAFNKAQDLLCLT